MDTLISSSEYDQFVRSKPFAVVLFDAPWNGTGRPLRPRFHAASTRFADIVSFGEVNADDVSEIAQGLNVTSVPTVVFYRDGLPTNALVGATQDIVRQTEELIAGKPVRYINARENHV